MSIGENIKKYRKLRKMTQKKLGECIDRTEITIRNYESDRIKPPLDVLKKISEALEVHEENLLSTNNSVFVYKKSYDLDLIKDLTYDIFAEIYNHSTAKDTLKFSANELIKQDKYYLDTLMDLFIKTTSSTLETLKERIEQNDNSIIKDSICINVNSVDFSGDPQVKKVDLTNKLNDPDYIKNRIAYYEWLLEHSEKNFDNYLVLEKLSEAIKANASDIDDDEATWIISKL